MPIIEVVVSIKQDGVELFGAPLHKRIVVDEATGAFTYQQDYNINYVATPTTILDIVQFLVLHPDRRINVRINGQTTGFIPVEAGGLLLLINGSADAGVSTNVTIATPDINGTTVVRGAEGGS